MASPILAYQPGFSLRSGASPRRGPLPPRSSAWRAARDPSRRARPRWTSRVASPPSSRIMLGVAAVGPFEDLVGVVPVLLEVLALEGEDRRAGGGDGRGGVVLGREDVARGPAHVGAQRLQGLDQHRRLDGHVQRAGDARALQRLLLAEFLARSPSGPGISVSAMAILLAAPVGEPDVLDDVVRAISRSALRGMEKAAVHISGPPPPQRARSAYKPELWRYAPAPYEFLSRNHGFGRFDGVLKTVINAGFSG